MSDTAEKIDSRTWKIGFEVQKWHRPEDHAAGKAPDETVEVANNLLMNVGITRMLNLLTAAGGQGFDATHSRIGVGDDTTAASAAQTDLQAASGSSHRQFKLVDSVNVSGQTVTWAATFGSSQANFAWQEWCIDPGTADATTVTAPMLNRKVASLGTKASPAIWVATATLTIT